MKVLLHNFQRAKSQLHILGFSNLENPCLTQLPTPKAIYWIGHPEMPTHISCGLIPGCFFPTSLCGVFVFSSAPAASSFRRLHLISHTSSHTPHLTHISSHTHSSHTSHLTHLISHTLISHTSSHTHTHTHTHLIRSGSSERSVGN